MNGRGRGRSVEGIGVALLVAYFLGQIVYYFSRTEFYGQGISYIINFLEIGVRGYVRVYLLGKDFSYYPPLYYTFLLAVWRIVGFSYLAYVLASSLFILGGAAYLYALLRKLCGPLYAMFGLTIFLLIPGTTLFSKSLLIEAPLLLFIPAVLYHLHASAGFTVRRQCILLGAATGLGLLTKWTFPAYVGLAVLYFIGAALIQWKPLRFKRVKRSRWIGMAWFAGIALLIAGPWYLFVFDFGTFRSTAGNDPRFVDYSYLRQLEYNVHLLKITTGKVFGPLLLCVVAALWLVSRKRPRILGMIGGLLAAPFMLFAVPVHMEDRYLYPLAAAMALTVPFAVHSLRWKYLRGAALLVIAGGLIYNHVVVYYPLEPDMYRDDDPVIHRWGALFWGQAGTREILGAIDEAAGGWPRDRVYTIAPHPLWTSYHTNFLYMVYYQKVRMRPRHEFRVTRYTKFQYAAFSDELESYDFLVIDGGMMERYLGEAGDEAHEYLNAFAGRGYVDQNTGLEFAAYGLDDVKKDYVRIMRQFVELRTFEFEGAYVVKVLVNRRRVEAERGGEPAPESEPEVESGEGAPGEEAP